jgi:type IV pilus assembly protein PilO
MADSALDQLEKYPIWQLGLAWVLGAGLVVGGWYFLYFSDIVAEKARSEAAVTKAETDLQAAKDNLANYEDRVKEQAALDRELKKKLEVVPVDSSTIDHLMSTFQREARGVGLGIGAWTPKPEQFFDFYAKIPVEVKAVGTWHEIGEFFRRVSEMTQIVNVEDVKMKIGKDFDDSGFPLIEVEFVASTFRLLTDDEQANGGTDEGTRRTGNKRGGK